MSPKQTREGEAEPDQESSSENARRVAELQELGEILVTLNADDLSEVPLEASLRDAVLEAQRLSDKKALERQKQFIGKLMRSVDAEAIRAVVARLQRGHRRTDTRARAAEAWRLRLLEVGDAALNELLQLHPELDRQTMRTLVRQARKDSANAAARSHRELTKILRELQAK